MPTKLDPSQAGMFLMTPDQHRRAAVDRQADRAKRARAMTELLIARKAGAIRNGWGETGQGTIWHAVEPRHQGGGPALCGAKPAIQWRDGGERITCPTCARRAAERAAFSSDASPPRVEGAGWEI